MYPTFPWLDVCYTKSCITYRNCRKPSIDDVDDLSVDDLDDLSVDDLDYIYVAVDDISGDYIFWR